jgi:hypothetical protein
VRHRPDAGQRLGVTAAVGLALVAILAVVAAMRPPPFVDGVTVVNDSPFDVHVDVRPPDGPALGLGTVPRDREIDFGAVLDQGETWSFTFTSGGEDGGSVDVTRGALERDGWRLTIPATTASRLDRAGLAPAPATRTSDS